MKLIYRYRKRRSRWRRFRRLLFVSPAEIAFIRLMGGHVLNVEFVRNWSGCQLVLFYDLGKVLKSWNIERELKVGRYSSDFGSYSCHKIIEVDGARWHMMVLADTERDTYLKAHGFDVLHIRAAELRNPFQVRSKVTKFLAK